MWKSPRNWLKGQQALEMAAKAMCQARDLHSNTAVIFNEAEADLNRMLVKVKDCVHDSSHQILAWSTDTGDRAENDIRYLEQNRSCCGENGRRRNHRTWDGDRCVQGLRGRKQKGTRKAVGEFDVRRRPLR